MSAASDITRRANSNLVIALRLLPRVRRDDMVVFYAFCRTMDDIADDAGLPANARLQCLDLWENGLKRGFSAPDELQRDVVSLRDRRGLPTELLTAIIDGCRMDLEPRRFQTWDELSEYIWKVACAVGLVSIRLFGCTDPGSERYAVVLGQALQLTNILRDVAEDLDNGGRIYLPMDDLARFGMKEADLLEKKYDGRFSALMEFEANRAETFYREAEAALPAADRRALLPARVMASIYRLLLGKIRAGGFRVLDKRHRLSKLRKLAILSRHLIAGSR